jgi:hypothetical protein
MPDRPPFRWSASSLAVSVFGVLLLVGKLVVDRRPVALAATPLVRRQLFIDADGVSWEAFQYARSRGLFQRFTRSARMIAPYPSMSHSSWTDIVGTNAAFGRRGRLPTVEARWFDFDAIRVMDDPREVIARQAAPHNYMRAFDTFFDPLLEPLMYFPCTRLFDRELEETERDILDGFTGERYHAYVSGTDAMAHTHKNDLHAFLVQFDAMLIRVLRALEARGPPVDVWLVSDHGNAGAFREGAAESYLTPVSMDPAIARAGLVRRDSGSVMASNDIAVVTIALASMVNIYFADLTKRADFAREVVAERGVAPASPTPIYSPDVPDVTVVLAPGIYGELFNGELWQRGLRAIRTTLGVRTLTLPLDGRCSASYNAVVARTALQRDRERRAARGCARPRYLFIGYSKGGIDLSEALARDSAVVRSGGVALVTLATPHLGSAVAERSALPAGLLSWASRTPLPAACAQENAAPSLFETTRRQFLADHGPTLARRLPIFTLAFTADVFTAHPWMQITKRIGQFTEPNDGVVSVRAAQLPPSLPSVALGTVSADHIAGITASTFPQEALFEAIVITRNELGVLDAGARSGWERALREYQPPLGAGRDERAPSFARDTRAPTPLPGGTGDWTPQRTFRLLEANKTPERDIPPLTRDKYPDGFVFRCDQRDMLAFRREYAFVYDAGNGGTEGNLRNGFSIVSDPGASTGRVCQFATATSAIKMTTVALRFRPAEYPRLGVRVRVQENVRGVDPSRAKQGVNDAAFKLWFVVRDTRSGKGADRKATRLFGYTWNAPNSKRQLPPVDTLLEAHSSRRSLMVTSLPEAWLITIGDPSAERAWQSIERDLAADLARTWPSVPTSAWEIVGITVQSDSDASRGRTLVHLDSIGIAPRK